MNPNDYDEDGNNIVPCPICLDKYCPSKEDGKCPLEDEFARDMAVRKTPHTDIEETLEERLQREVAEEKEAVRLQVYLRPSDIDDAKAIWGVADHNINKIISHTISETLKEAVRVIEGEKSNYEGMLLDWRDGMEDNSPLIKVSKVVEDLQATLTAVEGLAANKTNHD